MADEGLQPPHPMFADSYGEVLENEQEMGVADLFGNLDHDDPNASAMDDTVTRPDDMQSALIGAGTDAVAAAQFVDRFFVSNMRRLSWTCTVRAVLLPRLTTSDDH